ncbi:MAG TPA: M48 family metallopeptidase [Methylomirabilota bacterium]|nr:M48 family metallopeptidase [Methylomirabilota bacterium]
MPPPASHVWDAHYLDGRAPVRRPARVSIGRNGLEIALTEDGQTFRWALTDVRQTQGFYEGEQVRLERRGGSEALLVGDVRFLAALRAASPETARAFHGPSRRRAVLLGGVGAAVGAVLVALALWVWGIPRLADVAAARVPVAWEVALGEATIAQLAPAAARCDDPPRQRRIDDVVDTLLRAAPDARYPFRVVVVDRAAVNAFATPGGFIVVFRGLLDRTENAEELAGVLAHEIQHVLHRDATRAILRSASTGVLVAALVGDVTGVLAFGVQSARVLGDLHYSRDAERAADVDGLRLLQAASVDPAGMLAFFRAMEQGEGTPGAAARYLSTHPPSADRLQTLTALAAAGRRPTVKLLPDYDWSDVKKICARP